MPSRNDVRDATDMGTEDVPTFEADEKEVTSFDAPDESQALTMEDLEALDADDESYARTRQGLYPPSGNWAKSEQWSYSSFTRHDDSLPGDINPAGRTFVRVFGKPDERVDRSGAAFQPQLSILVSPDKRMDRNDPSKIDLAHRMFLMVRDLYISLYQEKFKKHSQWAKMLVNDSYIINAWCNNQGEMVVKSISQKRDERRSR